MKKLFAMLLILALIAVPSVSYAATVDCPILTLEVDRGGYLQTGPYNTAPEVGPSVYGRNIQILCTSGNAWWPYARHPDTGEVHYIHLECLYIDLNDLEIGLFGTAVLRKGDRGEAVKNLQRCLNYLGYNAGSVDGIFGNGTDAALRDFQESFDEFELSVDGAVGTNTKYAMLVATHLNELCERIR